jgi:hypothetical protein
LLAVDLTDSTGKHEAEEEDEWSENPSILLFFILLMSSSWNFFRPCYSKRNGTNESSDGHRPPLQKK